MQDNTKSCGVMTVEETEKHTIVVDTAKEISTSIDGKLVLIYSLLKGIEFDLELIRSGA